ncbi:uncharacterized protein LOC143053543 [Mytilus galloprovincialis]|uniref:uncharacterized protein LOC143053543 n=1 Tax=Mytilus galloprovincialis TaxID=29158 RepID=UPI003F7BAB81
MVYFNSTITTIHMIRENDTHKYISILEISNQLARILIPATVYLCIILVMGVIGNIIVLIVYGFRVRKTAYTILILILAALDLITCLFGVPYHILSVVHPLMFVWNGFCKSVSFILRLTTMSSVLVVNVIAYDRYRKICRPFQRQLSLTHIKIASFVVITVSVILSTPVLIMYGSTAGETDIANLTGTVCFISQEFSGTLFHQTYSGLIFLLFIVLLIFMISMYINVGRRILRLRAFTHKPEISATETVLKESRDLNTMNMPQQKTQRNESETHISMAPKRQHQDICYHSSANSATLQDKPDCDTTVDISNKDKDEITNELVDQNIQLDSCSSISKTTSIRVESDFRIQNDSKYSNTNLETKKLKKRLRVTLMLFVITTVFIISFLPYLTTAIVGSLNSEIWKKMSDAELVIYGLLQRTYLISSMSNPIVYWFLDKQFKSELCIMFGLLCPWC